MAARVSSSWQFWIDRGGTFTDIVARSPTGRISIKKLLSENPKRYPDAAIHGIREILQLTDANIAVIPASRIDAVKMGTTVGTNALLERTGARTALVITQGFGDALRIGNQNRPRIFARHIRLPKALYERVIAVNARVAANGEILQPVSRESLRNALQSAFDDGVRAVAVVLMHAYRYPAHELEIAAIAEEIGFPQISLSHRTSPLIKLIGRGDTTVVDAYVSPGLKRYVRQVATHLGDAKVFFMQSHGGLIDASRFEGKDSILSGPAGGIVGAVNTCHAEGFDRLISFDMGGTSTDVAHFNGEYERSADTEIAGVRLRVPMMAIHTVAAGGGSVLHFDGSRFQVGPDSAGADPGPACYRRGGALYVTDCNVLLGKIHAAFFPRVFGPGGDLPLDEQTVRTQFSHWASTIGSAVGANLTAEAVAEGFLDVAVENMADAIKKVSVERGHDIRQYTLCCFGGAGGQHACQVADRLGISRIFIHSLAGVLSAYGMGLADQRLLKERSVEEVLDESLTAPLDGFFAELTAQGEAEMLARGIQTDNVRRIRKAYIRYQGTNTTLAIDMAGVTVMRDCFHHAHRQRYGFALENRPSVVEAISLEIIAASDKATDNEAEAQAPAAGDDPVIQTQIFSGGRYHAARLYHRRSLGPGMRVSGTALIVEETGTNVVEPGWQAEVSERNNLILNRITPISRHSATTIAVDPVLLEIFNRRFMSIAEQMGVTLQNTSYSVNIKERLDFSCALFDQQGQLVANAPHIPVHLGSMGESVQALIRRFDGDMAAGDVYLSNSPYHGGTHLPDITVVTPLFDSDNQHILFYVACRGHHADVGGVCPGSMPPASRHIDEEGVLSDGLQLVAHGRFDETAVLTWLKSGTYPARNPRQNLADIQAQIAANAKGVGELRKLVKEFGLPVVQAYMGHIQDAAEAAVRRAVEKLDDGAFTYPLDNGAEIKVTITIDHQQRDAHIDFTGTSPQQPGNLNAPAAITKAAALYVFRTLVDEDIPLNAGCLRPLHLTIPRGSMLNPLAPAAVAAGNVETSQFIVDALYGALGAMAGSQGTMNNFTFGNDQYQYYETICGGSGAGPSFDGADAVQTHMTNSRMTDPEILEWRYPVRLEAFSIRHGSGGGGRHAGGSGAIRRIRFLEPMTASILSNHRRRPPFGAAGGEPGETGRNTLIRADGTVETLAGCAQIDVTAGDTFVIETPGGGGFGKNPL